MILSVQLFVRTYLIVVDPLQALFLPKHESIHCSRPTLPPGMADFFFFPYGFMVASHLFG
jgi:hypothetical protein